MKERAISFNTEMVRAILDGRKTQTRRIIKVQPMSPHHKPLMQKDTGWCCWFDGGVAKSKPFRFKKGNVGDRLWVREMFGIDEYGDVVYRADVRDTNIGNLNIEWRSAHLSRIRSRITLEITGIRVERLQDISKADAISEGAPKGHPSIDRISRELGYADFSRSWYGQLWDEIYGAGSWDANPWVWVIEFKRIEVRK